MTPVKKQSEKPETWKDVKFSMSTVVKLVGGSFVVASFFYGAYGYLEGIKKATEANKQANEEIKKEVKEFKTLLISLGAVGKNDKEAIEKSLASLEKRADKQEFELSEFKSQNANEHQLFSERYFELKAILTTRTTTSDRRRRR